MVTAIMIVEIMGRPPEHLKKSLEEHIAKLDPIKGIKIIKKEFSEPKEIKEGEEEKELFTCFSEVEFECESLEQLVNIMFDFMPASIEVVEPSNVTLASDEATSFMNNLTGRLHRYDDIVKIVKNKEIQMQQELNLAQQLLYAHNIIDKKGKILKIPEGVKKKIEEIKEKKDEKDSVKTGNVNKKRIKKEEENKK